MTDELKPCPFCGGEAELQSSTGDPWGEGRVSWRVLCKNHLGCQGGACNAWEITPEDASSKWNTRYERTCHLEQIPYAPGEYEGMRCSACKTPDLDMGLGPYCAGCGAKVIAERKN